jgi:hypothetical protein
MEKSEAPEAGGPSSAVTLQSIADSEQWSLRQPRCHRGG